LPYGLELTHEKLQDLEGVAEGEGGEDEGGGGAWALVRQHDDRQDVEDEANGT
jgi:hypothetical protein